MKTKLTCSLLVGLNLALAAAFAENQAPSPDAANAAPAPAAAETAPPAEATPPPVTPVPPTDAPANTFAPAPAPVEAPAASPAPTTPPTESVAAPASPTVETPVVAATSAPVESPVLAQADAPKPAATVKKDAETAPAANEILPLILFEDAPLNDAIKTLARQAGINFQFDPKLAAAAAPGPDGRPAAQATVSIRFENVTAEQALEAVLANHNLQIVHDDKTRTARITPKDPAAPPPLVTTVIQLKYTNPTNLVSVVKPTLSDKRSTVNFDGRTSKLIVVATEAEMKAVHTLVETLDTPTRQVLIEARIYETAKNPSSIKGIDWSGTFAGQNIAFGNNVNGGQGGRYSQSFSVATNPAGGFINSTTFGVNNLLSGPRLLVDTARGFNPGTAFLDADGVSAVVSFLNSDNESEVVATPRAVTLDNEKATLSVTRAFPIINITPGSANSPAGSQIQYTNLGTILEVTPRIAADDMVQLKVVPEVSNQDGKDQQTINGALSVANIFAVRKIEANVVIPSGHTLVMGGLISDSRTKGATKVPVLGDAPGIGALFRRKSNDHKKANLVIFVTPTIVNAKDYQATQSDFLKTRVKDHPDLPSGWWKTAEPHPWTQQQQQQQSGGQQ